MIISDREPEGELLDAIKTAGVALEDRSRPHGNLSDARRRHDFTRAFAGSYKALQVNFCRHPAGSDLKLVAAGEKVVVIDAAIVANIAQADVETDRVAMAAGRQPSDPFAIAIDGFSPSRWPSGDAWVNVASRFVRGLSLCRNSASRPVNCVFELIATAKPRPAS